MRGVEGSMPSAVFEPEIPPGGFEPKQWKEGEAAAEYPGTQLKS